MVYLITQPGAGAFVVEIELAELDQLQTMTATDILEFFGIGQD